MCVLELKKRIFTNALNDPKTESKRSFWQSLRSFDVYDLPIIIVFEWWIPRYVFEVFSSYSLYFFSTFLQKMMKSGLNRHLLKGYLYIQRSLSLNDIKKTVRSRINSQLLLNIPECTRTNEYFQMIMNGAKTWNMYVL